MSFTSPPALPSLQEARTQLTHVRESLDRLQRQALRTLTNLLLVYLRGTLPAHLQPQGPVQMASLLVVRGEVPCFCGDILAESPPVHGLTVHEGELVMLRYSRYFPFAQGLMPTQAESLHEGNYFDAGELSLGELQQLVGTISFGNFDMVSFAEGDARAKAHG